MKEIHAKDLKPGDVLVLPFGKTATIQTAKVGRKFTTIRTEHGTSRIENYGPALVRED